MSNNPINENQVYKKDLFDPLIKNALELEGVLKEILVILKKDFKGLTFDKGADFDKLKKSQIEVKKTTEQLSAVQKERIKLQKQQQDVMGKLLVTRQKNFTTLQKGKITLQEQTKATRDLIKFQRAEKGSADQLRLANKLLSKRRDATSLSTEKGRLAVERMNRAIDRNNAKILKGADALKAQRIGIGKYEKALNGVRAGLSKGLGFLGVTLGVRALTGAISNSIKAFDQQQRAEKSLEVALGGTSKELLKQASALQKLTKFGDEQIIQGQAFMAQMGVQEDQIKKITPLVLDFAEAQGLNVNDAFKLVSKSLGSSTNALSRYGISIEGAVGSNERLESAVDSLSKSFKGQAQAAANVGTGALKQLSNIWGDLQETIGGLIAKGILPFVKGMSSIVSSVDEFLQQPVSEKLMEERTELNILVGAITDTNTSQEARNGLIEELQQKYPSFLGNLDAETATNEELAKALEEANKEYAKKINLAIAEELLTEKRQELAESIREEIKLQKELAEFRRKKEVQEKHYGEASGAVLVTIRKLEKEIAEIQAKREKVIQEQIDAVNLLNKAEQEAGLTIESNTNIIVENNEQIKEQITLLDNLKKDLSKLKKAREEQAKTKEDGFGIDEEKLRNINNEIQSKQELIEQIEISLGIRKQERDEVLKLDKDKQDVEERELKGIDEWNKKNQEMADKRNKERNEQLQKDKDALEERKELQKLAAESIISALDKENQASQKAADKRIADTQKQVDRQTELADKGLKNDLANEIKNQAAAEREKAIAEKKALRLEKLKVLYNFAQNSETEIEALKKFAIVEAFGATIKGFEKGGLVEGGEQIIRINEKGQEFVADAQATSKYMPELEAMNKGTYDDVINSKYIMPKIAELNIEAGRTKRVEEKIEQTNNMMKSLISVAKEKNLIESRNAENIISHIQESARGTTKTDYILPNGKTGL